MNARGFQIPLADPYLDSAVLGAGPASAFGMAMRPGLKITVPFGWFIRAEVVCLSASATPGPGAASIGRLWVMGYQEDDKC
jgi:hypothetical protein